MFKAFKSGGEYDTEHFFGEDFVYVEVRINPSSTWINHW